MRRDGKRRGRASRSGGGHGARRSARAVVRPWPPSASAQWRDVRAACFALMPWPAWDAASCCSNPNPSIAAAAPWMGGFYNSNDVPARRRQTHKHKPGRSWRRPRRARCVAIIGTSGGCRLRRCFQEERQSALSPSIGGTPDGNQAKDIQKAVTVCLCCIDDPDHVGQINKILLDVKREKHEALHL
ncbi:uncharacterized protein LOC119288029 isoform X2 [Triticum dicoccoides]|uniref:uncharacterized protein LOC119288029 isoform X2 n=1 Tax=Triticum dicoccoides TaxID=85692 RepID=UPI00188E7F15|nr:uncharacterized protein LOC119288029 isoform X2 [Triticum dicoccoides]